MKSDGKYNLSFASFLAAPMILAVLQSTLTSVVSIIIMFIILFIAVKYVQFFSKTFGAVNLKQIYTANVTISLAYVLIANYMEEFRIAFLFVMVISCTIIIYPDLKRMDKENNNQT